jgi:hypothetical protein
MARRPTTNPRAVDAPGTNLDPGPSRTDMENPGQAPGRSMRPVQRPAKKFAEGGMVRGCSSQQMSGKGFSGSY